MIKLKNSSQSSFINDLPFPIFFLFYGNNIMAFNFSDLTKKDTNK
jgi:hypothetical protein